MSEDSKPTSQGEVLIEVGSRINFTGLDSAECEIALTMRMQDGTMVQALLSPEKAAEFVAQVNVAIHDVLNDVFLYDYFMAVIAQNQADMPHPSRHQLAANQVINVRKYRKAAESAARSAALASQTTPTA